MSNLGFRCFTSPTAPVVLTLRQQVQALSEAQRQSLLDGFVNRIPAGHLDHKLGLSKELIEYVYEGIDGMQERARLAMRGEIVITPAVLDVQGNVVTPAVYNNPPTTGSLLTSTYVSPLFITDFPGAFIVLVIGEMFKWSKYDGTGSFAFYKTQIIL